MVVAGLGAVQCRLKARSSDHTAGAYLLGRRGLGVVLLVDAVFLVFLGAQAPVR